jgi:hypothetical protein
MNRGTLYTVRDSALRLLKKFKEPTSSKVTVDDINNRKAVYSQLPALCDNCVLTSAVTTDGYKQCTAECPLFTAAAIRRVLCANSNTFSCTLPQRLGPQSCVEYLLIKQVNVLWQCCPLFLFSEYFFLWKITTDPHIYSHVKHRASRWQISKIKNFFLTSKLKLNATNSTCNNALHALTLITDCLSLRGNWVFAN